MTVNKKEISITLTETELAYIVNALEEHTDTFMNRYNDDEQCDEKVCIIDNKWITNREYYLSVKKIRNELAGIIGRHYFG